MARQSYSRNTEAERRRDLVQATLDCIAEDGLRGATVRAIARRAGVTNGLIRHHFAGKDQLIRAAYRETIEAMTMTARQAIADTAATPGDRLRRFIVASLVPPAVDARMLSLWASFVSNVRVDPGLAAVQREGYLAYRDNVEVLVRGLLTVAGQPAPRALCRRHAIKINAIVDGLWLEGGMAGARFGDDDLARIGVEAVESILSLRLSEEEIGEG